MKSGQEFLASLLNALLPNRAAPVLAKVIKAYEGAGANKKYACDVQVLTAGTLEETDQIIAEVPISPIWAGKKKRGVYAIPPAGQIVIVSFIGWNVAFPFIAGVWADEYEADDFKAGQFVITDGDGLKIIADSEEKKITIDTGKAQVIVNGDKIAIKNGSKSLFTILDTHIQNLIGMTTTGAPVKHVVDPTSIQKFMQDKQDLSLVLEA